MPTKRRFLALVALVIPSTMVGSCADPPQAPADPTAEGRLEASVIWDGVGLPGRAIEIIEADLAALTDSSGIAAFTLPPGTWTVRAYVNSGGHIGFQDAEATTRAGETTRVAFVDCVPCVGARR